MNIRVAVCDDDIHFAQIIKEEVEKYFINTQFTISADLYTQGQTLLNVLISQKKQYDVLFLDIDIPDLNGIDLAERIKSFQETSYFIFISNMETMVFRAFTVNPFWFVRKRCWKIEFPATLAALMRALVNKETHTIALDIHNHIYKIDINSLMYVECIDKNLMFHYSNSANNITVKYKLSDLEKKLTDYGFIRSHKGYLVNYRHIFSLGRAGIQLDNGTQIPISKYRLSEVKQIFGGLIE